MLMVSEVRMSRINPDRLREMLADTERRLATVAETIQTLVARMEAAEPDDPTAIETARSILATLKRVRAAYIADRQQISRLLDE